MYCEVWVMEFGVCGQELTPFQFEVVMRASNWLLCFSDLQVEPQYLSLSIYYSCCRVGLFSTREAKRHERNTVLGQVPVLVMFAK